MKTLDDFRGMSNNKLLSYIQLERDLDEDELWLIHEVVAERLASGQSGTEPIFLDLYPRLP